MARSLDPILIALDNSYTLKLELTENSTSVANNTSSVSWTLKLLSGSHSFISYRIGRTVTLAGTTVHSQSWSGSEYYNLGANSSLTLASGTSNIPHNADGALDMSAAVTMEISKGPHSPASGEQGSGNKTFSMSGTRTLTTIPRKSTLDASDGTLGTQQTLTITRASTGFTHTLTYACGSLTGQTSGLGTITGSGTTQTVTFTPPVSLAAQNTTGQSVSVTFTLATKNGSTTVGTSTKTVSMSIPSSVKPSCSATVVVVNDNSTVNSWGVAVKGYSKYKVTTSFTGAQGSTLKSRSVKVSATGQTLTASPATSKVLASTSRTVKVAVTDSRDRSSTEISVTGPVIYDYGNPTISEATAYRCDSSGTADDTGTYLYVKCSGDVSPCGSHNAKTVQYRRRATGGSWTSWASLTSGEAQTVNAGLSATVSYEVQFQVTDTLGSSRSVTVTIPTATVTMNLRAGGQGVAFGGYASRDNAVCFNDWDVYGRVVGLGFVPYINSNSDLDDYKTPGVYAVTINDVAVTLSHCPASLAGRLTVISAPGRRYESNSTSIYLRQIYETYRGDVYQRCGSSSTGLANLAWGAWSQIVSQPTRTTGAVAYTTTYASSHDIEVRKYPLLGMCYVEGTFSVNANVSANTTVSIATLPSGFRPTRTVALAVSMTGAGAVHVTTAGVIRFMRTTAVSSTSPIDVRIAGWFMV